MMVMVSNQGNLEFGYMAAKWPGCVGHLYSPGGQRGPWDFMPYALDNGAFAGFDHDEWLALLHWSLRFGQRPLWAVVPDVVANHALTLQLWHRHASEVRARGLRPAFACQDGADFDSVPDDDCMLFLGGTTAWKEAAIGPWCKRFPGRVHVGRVNTWDRLVRCWRAGAVSVDGTGWFHHRQKADLCKFVRETRS
jgi:hypothetical protein